MHTEALQRAGFSHRTSTVLKREVDDAIGQLQARVDSMDEEGARSLCEWLPGMISQFTGRARLEAFDASHRSVAVITT